jgi:hypothetical protein
VENYNKTAFLYNKTTHCAIAPEMLVVFLSFLTAFNRIFYLGLDKVLVTKTLFSV